MLGAAYNYDLIAPLDPCLGCTSGKCSTCACADERFLGITKERSLEVRKEQKATPKPKSVQCRGLEGRNTVKRSS